MSSHSLVTVLNMRRFPVGSQLSSLLPLILSAVLAAESPRVIAPAAPEALAAGEFGNSFASDGDGVLTLWKKGEALVASVTDAGGTARRAPVVLAPQGLDPIPATTAAAAWNGRDYLIVWFARYRDPARDGVYAVRMSREGELISQERKILEGHQAGRLALGWNGQRYLLTATDFPSNRPHATLLDAEGNLLSSTRLELSVDFIVPLGESFLLARKGLGSYVGVLDASLKTRLLPVATAPTFDIASIGSRALCVSSFDSGSVDVQTFDAFNADPPILLQTPGRVRDVEVVASGNTYVAILRTEQVNGSDEWYAAEIGADGTPIGAFRRLAGPDRTQLLDAVAAASDVIVAYRRDSRSELSALGVSTGMRFPLSVGRPDQVLPAISSGGQGYFTVWTEIAASGRRLVGSRLRGDGTAVGERVILATGDFRGYDVAFDGTDFLIAWATEEGIHLQRISDSGVLRDAETLLTAAPEARDLALSWNGFAALVAWSTTLSVAEMRKIEGALIRGRELSPLGIISRPAPLFQLPGGGEYEPHLAWTGSHWVMTWRTYSGGFCTDPCIGTSITTAVRIAATGATIDSAPTVVPGVEIASNGVDSLIVWKTGNDQIKGTRLSADGTLLDGMEGFLIADEGSDAAVIDTGGSFAVAWVRTDIPTNSKQLVVATIEGTTLGSALRVAPLRHNRLLQSPAIATLAGSTPFIVASERQDQAPFSESSLITGRFAAELVPVGIPPSAPTDAEATYDGSSFRVTWTDSSDNEDAFVVSIGSGFIWTTSVPADAESAHIRPSFRLTETTSARVWAQNAAGRSAVVTVQVRPARMRVSRN